MYARSVKLSGARYYQNDFKISAGIRKKYLSVCKAKCRKDSSIYGHGVVSREKKIDKDKERNGLSVCAREKQDNPCI